MQLIGWLVLLLAVTFPAFAQQACTRAFSTLEEARRRAQAKDEKGAEELLRQAELECPRVNQALNSGIAEVYRLIGKGDAAIPYQWNAERSSKSPVRRKFALVVGVGNFRLISESLKYAGKDAKDFHKFLVGEKGRFAKRNARIRTDEDASLGNVKADLAWIAANAEEDDLVVLYFSTHGSRPGRDASKNQSSYLILHDTDKSQLFATGLGLDELTHYLTKKLRAQRIVLFLDTCYSGDAARHMSGSKSLEDPENEASAEALRQTVAQEKGIVVITSADGGELSWESDELQNGFFTHHLLKALEEQQGLTSIEEVFQKIQRRIPSDVEDYTKRRKKGPEGKGASQHPRIFPEANIPYLVVDAAPQQ